MRQLRLLSAFMLTLFVLALSPQVDLAQANFLGNCTHAPNSTLYRPDGVVIRYERPNLRLMLIDLKTGSDALELDTTFSTFDLANLDWSPDCHYLFGTANGDAVIWDALNGGRITTFAHVDVKNRPYWNPGRNNLILETRGGSYLWNFTQSDPMLMTFSGDFCRTHFRYFNWQVEWDNARNQVLVAPNYISGNGVITYDQTSAQQVAYFDNACLQGPVKFRLTPDNRHVIVFTSEDETFASYTKALTVWDRDTMQHITVDANSQSAVLPGQVALSPDGRYLVLARLGTMRVWDLANLADDVQARDPIHRYPIEATTRSVRFISDTIVETTDLFGENTQWDVLSGAKVI